MSCEQFIFKELFVVCGMVIIVFSFGSPVMILLAISIPMLGNFIVGGVSEHREKKFTQKFQDEDIQNWLYTIERHPENVNAYVALGDIYFKTMDFEKAVHYYKKGYEIHDFPWIAYKLKIAEREYRVKKGEIWLCPECSRENSPETDRCKFCNEPRRVSFPGIKKELTEQKDEIKNDIRKSLFIFAGIIVGLLLVVKLARISDFFAIFFSLSVIFFTLRKFIKW